MRLPTALLRSGTPGDVGRSAKRRSVLDSVEGLELDEVRVRGERVEASEAPVPR